MTDIDDGYRRCCWRQPYTQVPALGFGRHEKRGASNVGRFLA
jgi:hypothetical protein